MAKGLDLPVNGDGQCAVVGSRLTQIKSWLDAVPASNLEACAERLLGVCREMSQAGLEQKRQLTLLGLLQPRISRLLQALTECHQQPALTASGHNLRLIRLVEALQQASVSAWESALQIRLSDMHRCLHPGIALQRVIYHTLRSRAERLQYYYVHYLTVPAGDWLGLHQLYALALKQGVVHGTVRYPGGAGTIHQVYLQALLLAALNPYRLQRGEASRILPLLSDYVPYVTLSEDPPSQQSESDCLWIDLGADAPPLPVRPTSPSEACFAINITALKRMIADRFVRMHRPAAQISSLAMISWRAQRDLLMRLTLPWWRRSARRAARLDSAGPVEVLAGLSRCHALYQRLTRRQWGGADLLAAESLGGLSLVSFERYAPHAHVQTGGSPASAVSPFYAGRDVWAASSAIAPLSTDFFGASNQAERQAQAEQLDHSQFGLRLRWLNAPQVSPEVGELVALRRLEYGNNLAWTLGVVRWRRSGANLASPEVMAGVEWLASRALPIDVRAVDGLGMGGGPTRAMVLEAEAELPATGRVIVAAGIYDVGSVLSLIGVKTKLQLTLQRVVESTDAFGCYEFTLT